MPIALKEDCKSLVIEPPPLKLSIVFRALRTSVENDDFGIAFNLVF